MASLWRAFCLVARPGQICGLESWRSNPVGIPGFRVELRLREDELRRIVPFYRLLQCYPMQSSHVAYLQGHHSFRVSPREGNMSKTIPSAGPNAGRFSSTFGKKGFRDLFSNFLLGTGIRPPGHHTMRYSRWQQTSQKSLIWANTSPPNGQNSII